MKEPVIKTLHVGKIEPLGQTEYLSAINKQEVNTPQKVTKQGLQNDTQENKKNHGGEDKAIHQYAWEHYSYWKEFLLDCDVLNRPGAFGENISSEGMTEETVCIGDKYKIGSCVLEVSQARQPCWKLNYRFDYPKISEEVQNTLKTGWYYRVIEEGNIQQGDTFELLERPYSQYSLHYLLTILYKDCLNTDSLKKLIQIGSLADSWKKIFIQRLETGTIENWENRLFK